MNASALLRVALRTQPERLRFFFRVDGAVSKYAKFYQRTIGIITWPVALYERRNFRTSLGSGRMPLSFSLGFNTLTSMSLPRPCAYRKGIVYEIYARPYKSEEMGEFVDQRLHAPTAYD